MTESDAQLRLAERMRAEEEAALQEQLLRSQAADVRRQLMAAVDLLVERTGMTRERANVAIAERIDRDRNA